MKKGKGNVPRDYRTRGQGVVMHIPKKAAEENRIKELVKLNDQRLQCVGARDRDCLNQVAEEYACRGMVRMAAAVRAEAGRL